ncbi:hypothetical protein [Spiroplasma citri]|uniref:hypothetical protein n=1 Tax=Spiroplasma citri TaxID=2133 RepID=UPI0020A4BCB4|nr:hypothetical protein [Spiroplasma citri]
MKTKVLTNNKWLDKIAESVVKIQTLTNIPYVDCHTCNYENQSSNLFLLIHHMKYYQF